jgi:hypothetical protein
MLYFISIPKITKAGDKSDSSSNRNNNKGNVQRDLTCIQASFQMLLHSCHVPQDMGDP